jgi:hypothetical protein
MYGGVSCKKDVSNICTNCWGRGRGEGNCANVRVFIRQCSWDSRTSWNVKLVLIKSHVTCALSYRYFITKGYYIYFSRNGPSLFRTSYMHADTGKLTKMLCPWRVLGLQEQGPNKKDANHHANCVSLVPIWENPPRTQANGKMTKMNLHFVLFPKPVFFFTINFCYGVHHKVSNSVDKIAKKVRSPLCLCMIFVIFGLTNGINFVFKSS